LDIAREETPTAFASSSCATPFSFLSPPCILPQYYVEYNGGGIAKINHRLFDF
jgi:hypothetical protein